MAASVEAHADEPWYEDARAALEAEEAGDFETDEELAELSLREFPFYFARYGDDERAYVDEAAWRHAERGRAAALQPGAGAAASTCGRSSRGSQHPRS